MFPKQAISNSSTKILPPNYVASNSNANSSNLLHSEFCNTVGTTSGKVTEDQTTDLLQEDELPSHIDAFERNLSITLFNNQDLCGQGPKPKPVAENDRPITFLVLATMQQQPCKQFDLHFWIH